jgi:dihydroorotate dehydrogenase
MLHLSRTHIALRLGQRAYTTAPPTRRLSSALRTSLYAAGTLALVAYYYDSRSLIHEHVLMPAVRTVTDAETSHKLAVELLSLGAWARPKDRGVDGHAVRAEMWGKEVVNPVGVAAGFDKDAKAIDGE